MASLNRTFKLQTKLSKYQTVEFSTKTCHTPLDKSLQLPRVSARTIPWVYVPHYMKFLHEITTLI